MIKSTFINQVVTLLVDADDSIYVLKQLDYIEEDEIQYTGMGVFIYFKHSPEVQKYLFKEQIYLDGVTVESTEFEEKANAVLHFKNGVIDYLEIFSRSGNYINKEPKSYSLSKDFISGMKNDVNL